MILSSFGVSLEARTDLESIPVPMFSGVLILNPSFPRPPQDALRRCSPRQKKIPNQGKESPHSVPQLVGQAAAPGTQHKRPGGNSGASGFVLPRVKSLLHPGAQSEALLDPRGSVCLLIQRRSPQLGPRAPSLRCSFCSPSPSHPIM